MATLLGVGQARLRSCATSTPDLRLGSTRTGGKQNTWSIDAFFTVICQQIAETLPDRLGLDKQVLQACDTSGRNMSFKLQGSRVKARVNGSCKFL